MFKKFIKLVGCSRYTYKGRSYEEKVVAEINDEELFDYLLDQKNDFGLSYFREVMRTPGKAAKVVKIKEPEPEFEEVAEPNEYDEDDKITV